MQVDSEACLLVVFGGCSYFILFLFFIWEDLVAVVSQCRLCSVLARSFVLFLFFVFCYWEN